MLHDGDDHDGRIPTAIPVEVTGLVIANAFLVIASCWWEN